MPTFTVLGVDSSTRRDRVVVVDADGEDQAAETALEQGLVEVKKVRSFDAPRPEAGPPWYENRKTAKKVIAHAVAKGVFSGVLGAVIVITAVLMLIAFMWWEPGKIRP
jgi:hypothetical protein